MPHYDHLCEIAVLPCLPPGLTVEDSMIERSSPCFDLQQNRLGPTWLDKLRPSDLDAAASQREIDLSTISH